MFSVRVITCKNVTKAVEDAGVRNAQDSEAYIIGNPGEGLHLQVLQDLGYTKSTKPQRALRRRWNLCWKSVCQTIGISTRITP